MAKRSTKLATSLRRFAKSGAHWTGRIWNALPGNVIAVIAFLISILGAYYNILREEYDVRIALRDDKPKLYFAGAALTEIDATHTLVFTNSGNRPLAVTDIVYWVVQAERIDAALEGCPGKKFPGFDKGQVIFPTPESFKPFVVKGGDVVVQTVAFKSAQRQAFPVYDAGERKGLIRFYSCLEINFVDPDSQVRTVNRHATHTEAIVQDNGAVEIKINTGGPYWGGRPITLFKRTRVKLPGVF